MPAGAPAPARSALVTGAGRGIGRALAIGLAAAGWSVGLVGRTRAHLDATAAECTQAAALAGAGGKVVAVDADVTNAVDVDRAVRTVEHALPGGIGTLVNNAGVVEHAELDFAADDVEDVWRVVVTNVRGPLLVTHAVLPAMLARRSGCVVNLNSGSGYGPSRTYTGYGISKGALGRLTRLLDAQYATRGLRAFDLAPGVVVTDMTRSMPVHDGRTEWTPVEASVELLVAMASGRLDAVAGRFVRAGVDTPASLLAVSDRIRAADARVLSLIPYGPDDPLG